MGSLSILLDANIDEYLDLSVFNYLREGFVMQLSLAGEVVYGNWIALSPGLV